MATIEEPSLEPNSPQQKHIVEMIEDYLKEQLDIQSDIHRKRIATEIWAISREEIRPIRRPK